MPSHICTDRQTHTRTHTPGPRVNPKLLRYSSSHPGLWIWAYSSSSIWYLESKRSRDINVGTVGWPPIYRLPCCLKKGETDLWRELKPFPSQLFWASCIPALSFHEIPHLRPWHSISPETTIHKLEFCQSSGPAPKPLESLFIVQRISRQFLLPATKGSYRASCISPYCLCPPWVSARGICHSVFEKYSNLPCFSAFAPTNLPT